MAQFLAGLAILAAGLYSGAAWYMTFVELPALRSLPAETARTYWTQSLRRTPRYAAAALIAAAAALAAGRASLLSPWTWGALSLFGVLPFTVTAILPLQRRLLEGGGAWMEGLRRWRRLHVVRTALGLAGTVLFLWAVLDHRT